MSRQASELEGSDRSGSVRGNVWTTTVQEFAATLPQDEELIEIGFQFDSGCGVSLEYGMLLFGGMDRGTKLFQHIVFMYVVIGKLK